MKVTALELRLEMPDPRRWLKGAGLAALLAVGLVNGQAAARGSTGSENPWAAEHVEGLPADIRRGITARERACCHSAWHLDADRRRGHRSHINKIKNFDPRVRRLGGKVRSAFTRKFGEAGRLRLWRPIGSGTGHRSYGGALGPLPLRPGTVMAFRQK